MSSIQSTAPLQIKGHLHSYREVSRFLAFFPATQVWDLHHLVSSLYDVQAGGSIVLLAHENQHGKDAIASFAREAFN